LDETRATAYRQAQQQAAQQQQQLQSQYEARLQQVQQQLHALVGVTPSQNPELDAVRSQFGQLYPGLSKMEERAEQLLSALDKSGDLESQNSHYWQSYGRQTMNRLFEHASTSLGGPLSEAGKRQLHAAFTGYVSSSPETTARYTNDPSLVDEFWREFTSSFVDPVRRASSASVMDRTGTPLPSDTPSGAPRVPGPPALANLDERVAQGWASYQATKR
jgi:DNA polymerase III gamma/tau subunit